VLAEKTFIGQRLDLEHYKGVAIVDFEIEYLDADGEAYIDLADFTGIRFDLFAKPHGKLLDSVDQDVPDDNKLDLNVPAETVDIRPTLYYYEIWGEQDASPSEDVLLSYGIFSL
jgi:hypothetical protein